MSTIAPSTIGLDWKFEGEDYLEFFPEKYPDLSFLHGASFQHLIDKFAHQAPEVVFDAISAFLVPYGYELWNVNTQSDEYALFLVPKSDSLSLKLALLRDLKDEGLAFAVLERVGACAAQLPNNVASPSPLVGQKGKKARLASLIEGSEDHSKYEGIGMDATPIQLWYTKEQTFEGNETVTLVDIGKWPTQDVDATGFYTDVRFGAVQPLYGTQSVTFWLDKGIEGADQLYAICDYETPVFEEWGTKAFGRDCLCAYAGIGETFFYALQSVPGGHNKGLGKFFQGFGAKKTNPLMMAKAGKTREIVSFEHAPSALLALNDNEVIVYFRQGDGGGSPSLTLVNVAQGISTPIQTPPEKWIVDPFLLGPDTIGFFESTHAVHPNCAQIVQETCYICSYNWKTRVFARAKLEGLGNRFTAEVQGVKTEVFEHHLVESFFGHMQAHKGHGDWFVLNYKSTHGCVTALAWLWNKSTNEVVKITTSQFPGEEPSIHYNPALDRYQANHPLRLDLLAPFEDIYRTCERGELCWDEE